MASYYRDPTASAAIGAVDKEILQQERLARRLQQIRGQRPLTQAEQELARCQFTGIHRRFLKLALED